MSIDTKTVEELSGYRFFVPSYQRGYRWTAREVEALLDDVQKFRTNDGKLRYCLQPLIVKPREDGSFEVVDGQQRLTTIFLLMRLFTEESGFPAPYTLEYETRDGSGKYLSTLGPDSASSAESNIDYHHMFGAYRTMRRWLELQPGSDKKNLWNLCTKFQDSVFFIWHEIPPEARPNEVFTKVNLGKIPLTNSELIKALLMSKDNYIGEDGEQVDDKQVEKLQTEMSVSWDRIEHGLRNDSLWYFLNQGEQTGTRIDLPFELLAKERAKKLGVTIDGDQPYSSFQIFSRELDQTPRAHKADCVRAIWDDVEKLYEEFVSWYDDLDKYHLIGYLIAVGVPVERIVEITHGQRRSAGTEGLLNEAKKFVDRANERVRRTTSDQTPSVAHFSLGMPGKESIRQMLLLFNLATLINKSDKQFRFPFDLYKKQKWDIEHVHATADNTGEADDSLGNLTLLDASTNRSYGDAPFNDKRREIMKRDENGQFVPLCTKNVFMKAYSEKHEDMSIWNDEDKDDYVSQIERTIGKLVGERTDE